MGSNLFFIQESQDNDLTSVTDSSSTNTDEPNDSDGIMLGLKLHDRSKERVPAQKKKEKKVWQLMRRLSTW